MIIQPETRGVVEFALTKAAMSGVAVEINKKKKGFRGDLHA